MLYLGWSLVKICFRTNCSNFTVLKNSNAFFYRPHSSALDWHYFYVSVGRICVNKAVLENYIKLSYHILYLVNVNNRHLFCQLYQYFKKQSWRLWNFRKTMAYFSSVLICVSLAELGPALQMNRRIRATVILLI